MNKEEMAQVNLMLSQLDSEQLKRINAENNMYKSAMSNEDKQQNIVELQLNVDKIKSDMQNNLLGKELKFINGNEKWVDASDDRTRIWSDIGVKQIMSVIHDYVNPNTLLSCYTEEEILQKVYTIGTELSDLIYCNLELFLFYPTPEQLYEKFYLIYKKQKFSFSENELYEKCKEWSIRELRHKENYYPITIVKILDVIHSTYKRALNGEERDSLRKQMMIHQSLNNQMPTQMPQKGGLFK